MAAEPYEDWIGCDVFGDTLQDDAVEFRRGKHLHWFREHLSEHSMSNAAARQLRKGVRNRAHGVAWSGILERALVVLIVSRHGTTRSFEKPWGGSFVDCVTGSTCAQWALTLSSRAYSVLSTPRI